MDNDHKNCHRGERNAKTGAARRDAMFPEIYELIYYNETLVRSELEVLMNLIQKKLQHLQDRPAPSRNAPSAFQKQLAEEVS